MVNEELKSLCDEDQLDLVELRSGRVERDRIRRKRVLEIIEQGGATEGEDYIRAAVIFQHGETLDDWWKAYEFGKRGRELGAERGSWLGAAAYDRWSLAQGKPIKFRFQYANFFDIYRSPQFDETTSDEELSFWNAPTLEDSLAFRNLRGMPEVQVVKSASTDEFQIDIVSISKPLVFSDEMCARLQSQAEICDVTWNGHAIFQNGYGWRWIIDGNGQREFCWMSIPFVPVIAHAVVQAENIDAEVSQINNIPAIRVTNERETTIYFKNENTVCAVTGVNRTDLEALTSDLQAGKLR